MKVPVREGGVVHIYPSSESFLNPLSPPSPGGKMNVELEYLKQYLRDNEAGTILDGAFNVTLYREDNELVGFEIALTYGGSTIPNISLIYRYGACRLLGTWGSTTYEEPIDHEVCERIYDTILMKPKD